MVDGNDLIALIDESASRECYRVGALVIRADHAWDLALGLDAVVRAAEQKYGVPRATELHAHRIFHALEEWRPLQPRQRIGVYSEALDVVARHGEAIIIRGVDRPRHRARYNGRYDPHEAALVYTMESLDRYAERQSRKVFLVADDCRFAAPARKWLDDYQGVGTWGYRPRKLNQIANIEFVDSARFRHIQAIDLVTYLKTRITSGVDKDGRAQRANERLWEKVAHLVKVDEVWYP